MSGTLAAALVDLDGTLVDRDAALGRWLDEVAGVGPARAALLALDQADGWSLAALSRELLRERPGLARDQDALVAEIREGIVDRIEARAGAIEGLERLRAAGLGLALVSNGGPSQRRKLAAAGIPIAMFKSLWISGEFGHAKPSPRIFAAALADLGVAATAAVMIGDAPLEDIVGAEAAGLASCWLAGGRSFPVALASQGTWPTMIAADFRAAVELVLDSPDQGKSKSRVSASRTSDE